MLLWGRDQVVIRTFPHEALQTNDIGVDTALVATTPSTRHSAYDGYIHIENIVEVAKRIILQDRKYTCIYMSTLCIHNIFCVLSQLNQILTV